MDARTPRVDGPIRILIVDDSAVMRSLLRSVLWSAPRIEVVGSAGNGASALQAMDALRPDLVLLDVEMPVMDGLATLRQMRAESKRVPVIVCSTYTRRGAKVTLEALATGAADYVTKPSGQASRETAMQTLVLDLIPKILALTGSSPSPSAPSPPQVAGPVQLAAINHADPRILAQPITQRLKSPRPPSSPSIVVLGISTGGPAALDLLLPAFPSSFPLPVLIVQHMPELFTRLLAERLSSRCSLRVCEAVHGEFPQPGSIYIARGNWHMELHQPSSARTPRILLNQTAPENHCRPSVDVLFRSAAAIYGAATLGVILTGMGSDGLAGCCSIRERGGTVLAQDQATSAVWGMPGAVAQAGLAHRILPLDAVVTEIVRLTSRSQCEAPQLRESMV